MRIRDVADDDRPDRPKIRCMVCWFSEAFGVMGDPAIWPRVMSLEDAADYAQAGASVWVDPWDMEDLAQHERIARSIDQQQSRKKWFEKP